MRNNSHLFSKNTLQTRQGGNPKNIKIAGKAHNSISRKPKEKALSLHQKFIYSTFTKTGQTEIVN